MLVRINFRDVSDHRLRYYGAEKARAVKENGKGHVKATPSLTIIDKFLKIFHIFLYFTKRSVKILTSSMQTI